MKSKEAEIIYRALFDQSPYGIIIVDFATKKIIDFNDAACAQLGYTRDEFTKIRISDFEAAETLAETKKHLAEIESHGGDEFNTKYRTKNGEIRDYHVSAKIIEIPGKKLLISIHHDITKRLRSEALYRTLFDKSPYGITLIDHETRKIVEFNDIACAQLGYTRDEFASMQISDFEAAETPEETKKHIAQVERRGGDEFNTRYHTKQGKIRDYHVLAKIIEVSGKKLVLSIHHDITEQLRTGKLVKEERDRAQKYLDIADVILLAIDTQQRVTLINRKGCEILGYPEDEIIGKNWFDNFLSKRVRAEVESIFRKIIAGEIDKNKNIVNLVLTRDGEERTISWNNTTITDEQDNIIGTLSSGEDITERERWEEELKLRAQLLNSVTDSVFLHDLDGNFIFVNEAAYKSLGYTKEEFMSKNIHQVDTPEHAALYESRMKELIEKGTLTFESVHYHKNGTLIQSEVYDRIIESGGRKLVLGVIRDITERKRAEEELKLSAQLLDNATDAIILHDIEGNFVFVNETTCKSFGYTREELLNMKMPQLNPPEQAQNFKPSMQELREKGSSKVELTILRKNGTAIPVEMHGRVIEYRGKEFILVVIRDITERKRAEKELNLRAQILDKATDSIFLHGFEKNFIYVNETMCRTHGYSREEFMNMKLTDLITSDHATFLEQRYQELVEKGYDTFESFHFRKDGSIMPVEIHSSIIELEQEKLILTVAHDITERKTSEEELRLRAQLLDNATDFIFLRDLEGNYAYLNETALKALGYSREEFMKLKVNQTIASGNTWVKGSLMEELTAEGTVTFETANKCKDGSVIPVEAHARLIETGDKKFILSVVRDITERKKFEETIRQLAYHDPLTGLPNRTLFNDHVTLALAQATRYNGRFALLMMDLDKFKEINDTLGHDIGDELLKEIGHRLESAIRKTDTLSRIGGDEFVLLISEMTNEDDAANVAQKILDTIREPFLLDGNEVNISTSIGIAVYPGDGKDIDTLTRHADFAMYTIKRGGRNGYLRYTPDMDSKASRRHPSAPLITKQETLNTDI